MSILATLAGMFATQKAADAAIGLLERFGHSEMTAQEKADWFLKYQEATKHQSPMRRFIALAVTLMWSVVLLTWLALVIVSIWFDVSQQIIMVRMFFTENITSPYNLIIGFYFGTHMVSSLSSAVKK